jgi:glycosyltransferase involved in cell wall biosynthesis
LETPRVSVIVPCYNLGEYLDEAVESVLSQTYQNIEVIIVNDGSTDRATNTLLADYRRPRTRVVQVPHAGLATARNRGIEYSTGRYLCAFDADDRMEPSFLEKATAVLDTDPSVTFVSTWLRTFGDESWEWKPERCDLPALLSEDTVLTAALVRRDAVVAIGGYDTAMPVQGDEDWDLWLTLVASGYRGVILPEVLFNYRRRPDSMSTICWHGDGHVPLANYRIDKHRDSYRAHLLDVLCDQDRQASALLRRNDELERYIGSTLEPALTARRDELAALRTRLTQANHVGELEAALQAASAEVTALRTSRSWRITAPLRRVYDWLWLRGRS